MLRMSLETTSTWASLLSKRPPGTREAESTIQLASPRTPKLAIQARVGFVDALLAEELSVVFCWAVAVVFAPPVPVPWLALFGRIDLSRKRGSTGPMLPEMSEVILARMARATAESSSNSRPAWAWLYWLDTTMNSASNTSIAMAKVSTISSRVIPVRRRLRRCMSVSVPRGSGTWRRVGGRVLVAAALRWIENHLRHVRLEGGVVFAVVPDENLHLVDAGVAVERVGLDLPLPVVPALVTQRLVRAVRERDGTDRQLGQLALAEGGADRLVIDVAGPLAPETDELGDGRDREEQDRQRQHDFEERDTRTNCRLMIADCRFADRKSAICNPQSAILPKAHGYFPSSPGS